MKRIFSISLISFSAFASDVSPTLEEAVKSYTQLHRVTPAPHFIKQAGMPSLCAPLPDNSTDSPEKELIYDEKKARDRFGPHIERWIHVYMNDLAQKAFLATNKDYPVGSVIIKEKNSYTKKTEELELGGMIKRKHSEKPSVDDWEFFYKEAGKKPSSIGMESCKDCHTYAVTKDFVFGDWQKLSLPKKIGTPVIQLPE